MPFKLSEAAGMRLGLLLVAVKPLRKTSRVTDINEPIRAMTAEKAYYGLSNVTDTQQGPPSQKALRILLAKE